MSIIRDRGCLYYMPWIPTFCLLLMSGAFGVWIHFSNYCYNKTINGLDMLGISADFMDRVKPAIVSTAVVIMVFVVVMWFTSLWRGFVEAAHDATGQTGNSAVGFMVVNALVNGLWTLGVLWLIILIMADAAWSVMLYTAKKYIINVAEQATIYGEGIWSPTAGIPCPGQCLNLGLLPFLSVDEFGSCVCSVSAMGSSWGYFDDAYKKSVAVLVGIWVVFVAAWSLIVDFACQFSHTKREHDYIERLTNKQFVYNP